MSIVPQKRPELTRETALKWLAESNVRVLPALIGRRGYYRDSMGVAGKNDRAIYDDAIALVTPTKFYTFNANVDPAAFREGIANLAPGVWKYRLGIHGLSKPPSRRYAALVQAAPVEVIRDGGKRERGYFGINIHRGAYHSTSSEGCQTLYPEQWNDFMAKVRAALAESDHEVIPYVLVERADA